MDTHSILSLFSGIGGLDLGVRAVIPSRTIAYVERDVTCASVLAARATEGLLDEAPIYSDIRTFPAERFAGQVDGIIGGFPCQPFSMAGKQKGSADERNMWPYTIRAIRSLRPRFAFLENVSSLTTYSYFGTILGDLAEAGYDAEWGCYTASEVGASHRRERVFILAYTDSNCRGTGRGSNVGNSDNQRTQRRDGGAHSTREGTLGETSTELDQLPQFPPGPNSQEWEWILDAYPELAPATCKYGTRVRSGMHETERSVRFMDDAWAEENRVASLMALGNAVVPQQAAYALEELWNRAYTG